jgi:4-amino-4-deoxy-L-arabinose transferase-like glycosyltransferase
LGISALVLYSLTLAPGLLPADSGEYQITGALLGVAHPPGFALYTVLSWLIARLPFLPPAAAINWFSALLAAATLALTNRAIRIWTGSAGAGLAGAAMLGTATTFWAQATTANVRAFTAFTVALALAALAEYERAVRQAGPEMGRPTGAGRPIWSPLPWLAAALGMAVSHHGSTVFLAAVLGLYALALDWRVLRRPWPPVLAGLLPFLAWLYFPLRAGAFGSPPNARTWEGFLDQILARGWSGDMLAFATPAALPDRLRVFGVILGFQWNWMLLALAALGALTLALDRPRLALALLGGFGVHAFIAITYRAPQTAEYLLPAYGLIAVAFGFGCARLFAFQLPFKLKDFAQGTAPPRHVLPRFAAWFFVAAVALAGLGWQFTRTLPAFRALAQDVSPRAYAQTLLEAAPTGALILANWHWATPLWYLREVEGRRPDVEIRYVVPHGAAYAQNWVDEIQAALPARPVLVTNFFRPEFEATGLRFLPRGLGWEVRAAPVLDLPADLTGAQTFGELEFLGYRRPDPAEAPDSPVTVLAAWRLAGPPRDLNFFVHLIGPDGRLYGQHDVSHPAGGYLAGEVLLDRYPLIPLLEAPPGEYTLVAGAYSPDGARLAEVMLSALILRPATEPPATANPGRWDIAGAELAGFDVDDSLPDSRRAYLHWRLGPAAVAVSVSGFDAVVPAGSGYATTVVELAPDQVLSGPLAFLLRGSASPSRYVPFGGDLILIRAAASPLSARPGETVTVDVEFLAARSITRDLTVKLDLLGAGWRAQLDTTPVGGGLPTLKWVRGARLRDRYTLAVPADARPGPAQLVLGWYDAFTQSDLPILDPRLAQLGLTAPLGAIEVLP